MKRTLLVTAAWLIAATGVLAQAPGTTPVAPATPSAPADAGTASAVSPGEPYSSGTTAGTASTTSGDPALETAERLKIWNSPEMQQARAYVLEYGQRSKQFTQSDAEQYLMKLERLSPKAMRQWLERFAKQQAGVTRTAEVAKAARQSAVEQALSRLQAVHQSYESFNQGQTEGALAARDQLRSRQQFAGELGATKSAFRSEQMASMFATDYSWIYMPSLRTQQAAAASSVPGDLRPGDPNNFIRGDVPIPGENVPLAAPAAAAAAGAGAAAAGAP